MKPFHSKPFILPNLFTFATSSIFNLRALPAHRPASPFHAHLLPPGSKQLAVRSVTQLLSSSTVFRIPYVHFLPHHLPHLIHPPQHFSLSLIPPFTPSSNPTSFSSPILLSCTCLSLDWCPWLRCPLCLFFLLNIYFYFLHYLSVFLRVRWIELGRVCRSSLCAL